MLYAYGILIGLFVLNKLRSTGGSFRGAGALDKADRFLSDLED